MYLVADPHRGCISAEKHNRMVLTKLAVLERSRPLTEAEKFLRVRPAIHPVVPCMHAALLTDLDRKIDETSVF